MKQDFKILARHFVVYGVSIYLSKLVGFFMIPIYTSYLTPADYGVLELLDLTMYVFAMLVGMGISNSVIRFYVDCKSEREKAEVISTAFWYLTALAICAGAIMITLSKPIASFIFESGNESSFNLEQLAYFLRIITCSQVLEMIAIVGIANLQAEKKSIVFMTLSVSKFVVAVSLNILFIVGMGLGVKGILYSGFITGATSLIAIIFIIKNRLGLYLSKGMARQMIKYGAPLIVSTLSMFVIHYSDRFFLERFIGLDKVGLYSLSYRFAMILPALFYAPFSMIWNTQMFVLYKKGDEGRKMINFLNRYILIGSLMIIIPFALGIKEVVIVMADVKFHEAYKVVPVLLIAFLFIGLSATSSVGTYFAKKTIYRGLATGYGAFVALVGNYYLINLYGYWGAVIATVMAFFVRYIALSLYSQKYYKLDYSFSFYARSILAAGIAYLLGTVISVDNIYAAFILKTSIGLLAYLILLWIMRVIGKYEIEALKTVCRFLLKRVLRNQ